MTWHRAAHRAAIATLAAAAGFGCTLQEPKIDENAYPSNYKEKLLERLHGHLEDPVGVRDAFISEPALRPVGGVSRYVVCVRYNGRDRSGRYMGPREIMGVFHSGLMTQMIDAGREQCGNAAYQPFPELTKLCKEIRCPNPR